MRGSNRKTSSETKGEGVGSEGKRRERTESGSAGSCETKSHVPPLAFFLGFGASEMGWERMEIRPEQELVVK